MSRGADTRSSSTRIVLLGGGHTTLEIVRRWKDRAFPHARLTLVSEFDVATYSGMLPATLAGLHPQQMMDIPLENLCRRSRVDFMRSTAESIDADGRRLVLENGESLQFDRLVIAIGSTTQDPHGLAASDHVVPVRPMPSFRNRLDRALRSHKQAEVDSSRHMAIIGGGWAGIELAFCLRAEASDVGPSDTLSVIENSDQILPRSPERLRRIVEEQMDRKGIQQLTRKEVTSVSPKNLHFADGSRHPADIVILATGPAPPALAQHSPGLKRASDGFFEIDRNLRSTSHPHVFAVGDCATMAEDSFPKAGVYAVRQAPVLWENLRRSINEKALKPYCPQSDFLKLLSLGDGNAAGEFHGFGFSGRWAWWLKRYLDRSFVRRYRH